MFRYQDLGKGKGRKSCCQDTGGKQRENRSPSAPHPLALPSLAVAPSGWLAWGTWAMWSAGSPPGAQNWEEKSGARSGGQS